MKTTYQLSPMTASTIAHCYDSARAALQFAREVAADKATPPAVKFAFTDVAATLRSPIERIEKGIPSVKQQEFQEHIVDADPLIFKNIQYLYSRMTKEKKELLELAAEHILKGDRIEFEDEKVKQMNHANDKSVLDMIVQYVSEKLGVEVDALFGRSRKREIAYARQLCIYLIKRKTKFTFSDIGRYFNRDHTTVIHSINAIKDLMDVDKNVRKDVAYFNGLDYTRHEVGLKVAV